MPFMKRRPAEGGQQAPTGPGTLIGLLWALTQDWGRTLRFIMIVMSVIIACIVGISLGIGVIILAEREDFRRRR